MQIVVSLEYRKSAGCIVNREVSNRLREDPVSIVMQGESWEGQLDSAEPSRIRRVCGIVRHHVGFTHGVGLGYSLIEEDEYAIGDCCNRARDPARSEERR